MVFVAKMKSKISMPQVGKFTKSYWISRGWSVKDAEEKREKRKVGKKSPMCIEFWLERGFTEEESIYKIRSQRKINVEYWLDRGYSIEESKSKIREFQTENNHKRNQKLENDIDFRNNMKSKQSMFIEYWLEKGFNEEESKKRLSERQSTFSLKKCIEKHGEEKGSIIWKDRQIKWKNSLLESGYDGKKGKDSKSIEHIKKKFGDNWIDKFIEINYKKDKEFMKKLTSFSSYQDMINYMIFLNLSFGEIFFKIHNALIPAVYSISYDLIHEYLISKFPFYMKECSVEYYHFKHGDDWIEKFIQSNCYKNKDEIRELLKFDSYTDLIDFLVKSNYSLTEISLKIQNKILLHFYNCSRQDFSNYLMSLPIFKKTRYGNIRYFNNHLCRSDYEFEIARFLVENNISYRYEVKYPGSNYKCDFYLIDLDCYVEFMGIYKDKEYVEKYEKKKNFCLENSINHIFSIKVEEIKKLIKDEIEAKFRTT
jgi:hypothetical protein